MIQLITLIKSPRSMNIHKIFGLLLKGLGIVLLLVEAWLDHVNCYVDT